MPSKVLLISLNTYELPYPVFPLGIAYLDAALQQKGHDVSVIDLLTDSENLEKIINDVKPDFVGISIRNIDDIYEQSRTFFAPELYKVVSRIRVTSNAKIILGGSGYSLFPKELLVQSEADFGILGEGETSLISLIDCLNTNTPCDTIPGLVYRCGPEVVLNQRECIKKMPQRLLPNRRIAMVDSYLNKSAMLNLQTQRGCGFRCCYCTYPLIEGKKHNRKDPIEVCDDIDKIIALGAPYLFIVDSIFNSSVEHVYSICEEIIKRKLSIKWGCYLRPKGITKELMGIMAKAGLTHIEFGSDSLCDTVLDAYGKGFTFSDILESSELAQQASTHYAHFLIFGGPRENATTISQSFTNAKRIQQTVFFPFVGMRIYPGTPLHSYALNEQSISEQLDLLTPQYYSNPEFSLEEVRKQVIAYSKESNRWFYDGIPEKIQKNMATLRKIGMTGPLWDFLVK